LLFVDLKLANMKIPRSGVDYFGT